MRATTDRSLRRIAAVAGPVLIVASAGYAAAGGATTAEILAIVVVSGTFVAGGLVAWARRPENLTGRLLVAAGLCQVAAPIGGPPLLLAPVALVAGVALTVVLVYLILSFPSCELRSSGARSSLVVIGLVMLVVRLANLGASSSLSSWGSTAANPYQVIRDPGFAAWIGSVRLVVVIATVVFLVAMVVARWLRATGPARRALSPVLVAGAAAALVYLTVSTASLSDLPEDLRLALLWSQDISLAFFPIGFLVGFLWVYMGRSAIADLVVELGETPTPAQLRTALANALGDPTLDVAWWSPATHSYVGVDGEVVALPADADGRAVTRLERDGAPIAAIVHDPALLEDPGLVASVASAMRLAVENERLQSEVERQLEEVRASRARIVEAGDAERHRLERDLHDGAQQRLVALSMALRMARLKAGDDADPGLRGTLAQASDEARMALAELRELARGIHPAILTEAGLRAAVESLADRSVVPTAVAGVTSQRFSPTVERTGYFFVSEALTNANKHSGASHVRVRLERRGAHLLIEVSDDGIGGASVDLGTGLRGLRDRLAAVDGTLTIESPEGGGTRLLATIPVGPAQ